MQEVETQVREQNSQLEQEIQDFIAGRKAVIESNKAKLETAQQAQHRYIEAKQAEEHRLYETVAPFVAAGENPVIVSGSGSPKPDSPKQKP